MLSEESDEKSCPECDGKMTVQLRDVSIPHPLGFEVHARYLTCFWVCGTCGYKEKYWKETEVARE